MAISRDVEGFAERERIKAEMAALYGEGPQGGTGFDPSTLAQANEDYRATKQAMDAEEKAAQEYYSSVRGTNDDPFRYNSRRNDDTGWITDAEGNTGMGMLGSGQIGFDEDYLRDSSGYGRDDYLRQGGDINNTWDNLGGIHGIRELGRPGVRGEDNVVRDQWGNIITPGIDDPYQRVNPAGIENPKGLDNGIVLGDFTGGYDPGSKPYELPLEGDLDGDGTISDEEFYKWLDTDAGGTWYDEVYSGGNLEMGNDGIGVESTTDWSAFEALRPELQGYESSSNKDFYQKQFQDMNYKQNLGSLAQYAAAVREPKEQVSKDPWGWVEGGLPEVVTGTGDDPTRNLNPEYEGMTNSELAFAVSPFVGDQQANWYQSLLSGDEGLGEQTNWSSGGYDALSSNTAQGGLNPQNKQYMQDLYGLAYPQQGGLTPGGIPVPAGYASPINA